MILPLDLLQAEVAWAERRRQAEQAARLAGLAFHADRSVSGGGWLGGWLGGLWRRSPARPAAEPGLPVATAAQPTAVATAAARITGRRP